MSRKIKIAVLVLLIAGIILLVLYNIALNTFAGKPDGERREKLIENFSNNEKEFADLTTYFNSIVIDKEQMISFGLKKNNKVNLIVSPAVIDPANKAAIPLPSC